MASSKKKKGKGSSSIAAKKKKIKRIIIGSGMAFSMMYNIVTFSLVVLLPLSVIGAVVDAAINAAKGVVRAVEDIVDDFKLIGETINIVRDELFSKAKAFFLNDYSGEEAREEVRQIIKYAGRNQSGGETEYGNTMNAQTSIVYEFFIEEYSKYLDAFKMKDDGTYGSYAKGAYQIGQKFIDAHKDELPENESSVTETTREVTEVEIIRGEPHITTTTQTTRDYVECNVETKVILTQENDEFTNFFKPVFYSIAANALGTQNKAWGQEDLDGTDEASKTKEAFRTLLRLVVNHCEKAFVVVVEEEPTSFTDLGTFNELPYYDANGDKHTVSTHNFSVEVKYRIDVNKDFIDNLVKDAYEEGEKYGGEPYDESDKVAIKAQVDALAKFYGGELIEYDESEGMAGDDGWGTVVVNGGTPGAYAPGMENVSELFANIDTTGCNEGALKVLNVLKQIGSLYNNGVRFQNSGCLRTIQDMLAVAGYTRPGYFSPNDIPSNVYTHTKDAPPCSGYSVLTKSRYLPLGPSCGHIGIYFKTTDGKEYIFDNEGGKIKVHEYNAWLAMYDNANFGYTGLGCY